MVGEINILGGKYIESMLSPSMRKRASRYEAVVTNLKPLTQDLFEVELSMEQPYQYTSGQYVWVEALDKKGKPFLHNKKAFSILDAGGESNKIHILYRANKESPFKSAIKLKSKVILSGPRGSSLCFDMTLKQPIVCLAGGTGVAPFVSMFRSANSAHRRRVKLVYCAKGNKDLVYASELTDITKKYINFELEILAGELNSEDLSKAIGGKNFKSSLFAVVGSQGFVNFSSEVLLSAGCTREQMVFENFYPQGKGVPELFGQTLIQNLDTHLDLETGNENFSLLLRGIEQSNFHVIITDTNGVALYANPKASQMTGFAREEILGNTPRLWGGLNDPEYYRLLWSHKLKGKTHDGEIINQRKSGELYVAMAHISPIYKGEELTGFIATEEDITELKATQQALKSSEERFALAVEGSSAGIWDWNVLTGQEWWSEQFYQLLGYSPKELPANLENFENLLHPEDRKATFDQVNTVFEKKVEFRMEYRLKTKKQGFRWFLGTGAASFNEDGVPVRMVGTIVDIHNEVVSRQKLAEQNEDLSKFNNLLVGRELKMIELKETIKKLQNAQKTNK